MIKLCQLILLSQIFISSIALGESVLLIGDSIFALNRTTAGYLRSNGFQVKDKSRIAAKMSAIATQYSANRAGVKTVVMNGGGNDILLGHYMDCVARNAKCKTAVRSAIGKGKQLMKRMERDGVEKIIYVGLYHFRGFNKTLNPTVDEAMSQVKRACATVEICTFIDSRKFIGQGDLKPDDIHPTAVASKKMGRAIVRALRKN